MTTDANQVRARERNATIGIPSSWGTIVMLKKLLFAFLFATIASAPALVSVRAQDDEEARRAKEVAIEAADAEELPAAAESDLAIREEIVRRQAYRQRAVQLTDEGVRLYGQGRFEDAAAKLEEAVRILPRSPITEGDYTRASRFLGHTYYQMALAAYNARNPQRALELAERAAAVDPGNSSARALAQQISAGIPPKGKRPDLAPEFLAKKKDIQQLFREGRILMNSGQYDEAEKRFYQIIGLDEYNIDAINMLRELARLRMEAAQVGYLQARERRLWEVEEAWRRPLPREVVAPKVEPTERIDVVRPTEIARKLREIILPEVNFREANINDVVTFLALESRRRDPDRVGVNFVLRLGERAAPAAAPVTDMPPEDEFAAPAPAPAAPAGPQLITLTLHNISLEDTVRYVTSVAGLKYWLEPNAVVIVPADAPEGEMITKFYPVQPDVIPKLVEATPETPTFRTGTEAFRAIGEVTAIRVEDVKKLFEGLVEFPAGSSISYNPRISTIIMRNTLKNHEAFERVLAQLNVAAAQVEIEAKFVEIGQENLDDLGFEWQLGAYKFNWAPGFGQVQGGVPSGFPTPLGTTGDPLMTGGLRDSSGLTLNPLDALLAGLAPGAGPATSKIATFSGILTKPEFAVTLHALAQKKGVDILSAPKVTTKSAESATIKIIREFIYPTEYDPAQVIATSSTGGAAAGAIPATPRSFTTREVGVILNVTPTVGPDGYTIDLVLLPEVSEFEGFIDYGSPISLTSGGIPTVTTNRIQQPLFNSRKVDTKITIWDGQTVVLGGLIKEDIQKFDDKIPFLGDIPGIGRLFRSKVEQRVKRNLLIFVTARLIDPSGKPIHREQL
jgi:general secretion pathway protein D